MKNLLLRSWPEIVLIALSGFIIWPLFTQGYFFHHDDLQVMRIFEMRKCIEDLQIPCRWVPDMGYGNGYPLFNYYSVLPYYIGVIFSFLVGFVNAAKVLFFIPLILGVIGMYYLGKELFGKVGGFATALLYEFAPYRALDIYVRGAIAEIFAMSLIPFVFYFSLRLIRKNSRENFLGTVLSSGLFLMCHNIMTMFFLPILLVWVVFWIVVEKSKNTKNIILSFILGLGLAAFFVMPVFLEKDLVKTESLLEGGTNFRAHFVSVGQLFTDRSWDYGASVFGPNDTISFQIGWPLWWLIPILLLIISVHLKFKTSNIKKEQVLLAIFLFGVFLLSIFLMHNKSAFIWEKVGPLQYAQFPWRFLSVTIFAASLLGGLAVFSLPKKIKLFGVVALIFTTVFLNWQYFKPKDFYPWVDDHVKLSEPLWEIQQKAGLLDYLPKAAYYEPQGRAPENPEVRSGKAYIENYKVKSNSFSFDAKIIDEANIEIPVLEFPVWITYVNGKEYPHSDKNHWGRIRLDLPPGDYQVSGRLHNTFIRNTANILTFLSFIALIIVYYHPKLRKILF